MIRWFRNAMSDTLGWLYNLLIRWQETHGRPHGRGYLDE